MLLLVKGMCLETCASVAVGGESRLHKEINQLLHDDRGDSKCCKAINVCNEYCTEKPEIIKYYHLVFFSHGLY